MKLLLVFFSMFLCFSSYGIFSSVMQKAIAEGDTNTVIARFKQAKVNEALLNKILSDNPLHTAAEYDRDDMIKIIAKYVEIDALNKQNETALHIAAKMGKTKALLALLDLGADIEKLDGDGETPLRLAADSFSFEETTETVIALVNRGAKMEDVNKRGETAFLLAAAKGNTQLALALARLKANIKAVDKDGNTAVHLAAKSGRTETTPVLLDLGAAQIEDINEKGETALHLAAKSGKTETALALANRGAKIEALTLFEETPLHLAAKNGYTETVLALEELGANINAVNKLKQTALHLVAFAFKFFGTDTEAETKTTTALLDLGININAVDGNGNTALHTAADEGKTEIALVLLDRDANAEVVNTSKKTALDLFNESLLHARLSTYSKRSKEQKELDDQLIKRLEAKMDNPSADSCRGGFRKAS